MVEEAASKGKITEIKSAVVDARFSAEEGVPPVNHALVVEREDQEDLVLEVARHLGDEEVRAIAMDSTDGLRRGQQIGRAHV